MKGCVCVRRMPHPPNTDTCMQKKSRTTECQENKSIIIVQEMIEELVSIYLQCNTEINVNCDYLYIWD